MRLRDAGFKGRTGHCGFGQNNRHARSLTQKSPAGEDGGRRRKGSKRDQPFLAGAAAGADGAAGGVAGAAACSAGLYAPGSTQAGVAVGGLVFAPVDLAVL